MTCIVGLEASDGRVIIGADSFVGNDVSSSIESQPKCARRGELIIAPGGSIRFAQILLHDVAYPDPQPGEEDEAFLYRCVEEMRKALSAANYLDQDGDAGYGGEALIGYRGGLYRLGPDFGFFRHKRGYDAIGTGEQFALGSLHSTLAFDAHEKVRRALHAAAALSSQVRGPFDFIELPPAPKKPKSEPKE
ncbi:MAG: hypothetical protein ACE366_16680 [Bradymonadia bacterium]